MADSNPKVPVKPKGRVYKTRPARIAAALAILALHGKNYAAAVRFLASTGQPVHRTTLVEWATNYPDLYDEAVEAALADKDGSTKAIIEAFKLRMMSKLDTVSGIDAARIVEMMAKLQALAAGNPTDIVRTKVEIVYKTLDKPKADAKPNEPGS